LFSVATRFPPEFRVSPAEAALLLEDEVFGRMTVHDLPQAEQLPMLRAAARDAIVDPRGVPCNRQEEASLSRPV